MVRISEKKLLEILEENARLPFVRIAEKLGVSEAAVRKKVASLEKKGVIKKYTIEIDPKKLGFEIVSLIGIDTIPEKFVSVLDELVRRREVKHLYSASGDHMILIESWFGNSKELREFVKKLESMEGVTKVCPAIILEKIK